MKPKAKSAKFRFRKTQLKSGIKARGNLVANCKELFRTKLWVFIQTKLNLSPNGNPDNQVLVIDFDSNSR